MENCVFNGNSVLQMFDDNALEKRRSDPVVPGSFGIHNNYRSVAANAQTRRLASLHTARAEEEILALEEIREESVELASAMVGRAKATRTYQHVPRVGLHARFR
jgi:hypothetical protein